MNDISQDMWGQLYDCSMKIAAFDPWSVFKPGDPLLYIDPRINNPFYYDFVRTPTGKKGIACYYSDDDYYRSRQRLYKENRKNEPAFILQNAMVAIWGDREDVCSEDYAIIKELGYRFRGSGKWLYFEQYVCGYAPYRLGDEIEAGRLLHALGNLLMMVRGVFEKGVELAYDEGCTLLRWYSEKDELYYTHSMPVPLPKGCSYPCITVQENDTLREVKKSPRTDWVLDIDWFYFNDIDEYGDELIVPRMVLFADHTSGKLLGKLCITVVHDVAGLIVNKWDEIYRKYGKPKEIHVCEEELKALLAIFCKKIKVKLVRDETLPACDKLRLKEQKG